MKRPPPGPRHTDYPITRRPNHLISPLAVLLLAVAAAVVVLAAGLRPDSFFAGDPGVKLFATLAAIAHPRTPFEILLPVVGADSVPHVEPFFLVHGNHAHALTSPLLPIMSAPLLAAFGLRGLYILPALGFLLAAVGCAALAVALDTGRRPLTTAAVALVGTPFLFYGLEFWEHMPAVACAAMGAALCLRGRAVSAGVLLGMAVLFRPEAAWFIVAIVAASPLLARRPSERTQGLTLLAGLLTMAPYELYVLRHFGSLVPPHISANTSVIAPDWLASRWALFPVWFGLKSNGSFWSAGPAVVAAAASLGLPLRHRDHAFLWTVAVVDVLLTLVTAPNDGGGQWGPRYLLFAYVPLAVIAADTLDQLPRRNVAAGVALAAVLAGCLWVQRSGYRQLRTTKASYGRIVDFVRTETSASSHIVTDVWWLDQIAASAIGTRQLLYAPENDTGVALVRRLSDATVPVVTVMRSATESADTSAWNAGSCYVEERRDKISVRDLVAIRLRHRCQ